MLVKTSLNDSQVMYWEPAKYVAKLRTLKTNDTLLLFHINMDAGTRWAHQAATIISKRSPLIMPSSSGS